MDELKKEKKCFKCNKLLHVSNFYVHKQMTDGYLNKCKDCTKLDVKNNESLLRKNTDWVEKQRKRGREKYYRLEYKDLYKPTTDKKKEAIKKYQQKFPEKALASKYTEIFLNKKSDMNLHHWSYLQEHWLDVIELSIKDHNFIHRYIIYDQERMQYRNLEGILLDSRIKHVEYFDECKFKYEY